MENFIISKYTYLLSAPDGKFLVYNSRTNSFIKIEEELYRELELIKSGKDFDSLNEKTLKELVNHKVVITKSDEDNYYTSLKFNSYLRNFSQHTLTLTLVPTTGCNFDCPYCFERNKDMRIISDEVINNLITFINTHKNAEKLSITWFGGEPLLATKKIIQILDRIKEETSVKLYDHSIVTNGYLFDFKAIEVFKKHPLNSIQITLDGDEKTHNEK